MFQSIIPVSKKALNTYESLNASAIAEKLDLATTVYSLWKTVPLTLRVKMIRNIAWALRTVPSRYASLMRQKMGKLKGEAERDSLSW
ncbi:MAG: hypothetical protein KDC85_05810 [Saprospiraceae bacterium]|nr:hypothetical protein [Saprospiraceae bacterium]MCB9322142.1 hypothetical protein [Lewinellaceae bacterium]